MSCSTSVSLKHCTVATAFALGLNANSSHDDARSFFNEKNFSLVMNTDAFVRSGSDPDARNGDILGREEMRIG